MPDYTYADVTLASTFPVRELNLVRDDPLRRRPAFAVRLLDGPPAEPMGTGWRHHWHSDVGDLTLSLATSGDGFLLRFPGLADFVISRDTRRIAAWPPRKPTTRPCIHLLLDQVLPRLLGHLGRLVLHASAVEVDGRAIAFAGQTGRGKSTLAASLHQAGCPLLCDDALIVAAGEEHPRPAHLSRAAAVAVLGGCHRPPHPARGADGPLLRQAPARGSRRMRTGAAAAGGALPARTAPQDDAGQIEVTRLSARDACIELIRYSFQLDVTDRELAGRLLAGASEVAERCAGLRAAISP